MTPYEAVVALCDLVMDKGDDDDVAAWQTLKAAVPAQQTNNSAMVPCKRFSARTKWQHCLLERTCGDHPCMVAQHQ